MHQQENVLQEIEVLKGRFTEVMENGTKNHLSVIEGKTHDEAVEAVLYQFMDEEGRLEYCQFFEEVTDIFDGLSPDAFLGPHVEDIDTLARMHWILREAYWPETT